MQLHELRVICKVYQKSKQVTMKRIDINIKYRAVAIFCAIQCGKNDGTAHLSWDILREKFGINWQTYTHELHVKGMLYSTNGFEYLRPAWQVMTPSERMEEIKRIYPYPYQLK